MMTANTTYFYSIENYKKSKPETLKKNQKTNITTLLLTTIQLSDVKQL